MPRNCKPLCQRAVEFRHHLTLSSFPKSVHRRQEKRARHRLGLLLPSRKLTYSTKKASQRKGSVPIARLTVGCQFHPERSKRLRQRQWCSMRPTKPSMITISASSVSRLPRWPALPIIPAASLRLSKTSRTGQTCLHCCKRSMQGKSSTATRPTASTTTLTPRWPTTCAV